MSYTVQIQQLESVPLAVVRRQARASELSRLVPECCGIVWNAVRAQGTPAGRHVALYWDGSIRLEVGVELSPPGVGQSFSPAFLETAEIVHSSTPTGPVAWTTHFGPYGGLGAAHGAVREWCRANNHTLAGPCWEIYDHWKDEWNTDPARIRTDIHYLLSA